MPIRWLTWLDQSHEVLFCRTIRYNKFVGLTTENSTQQPFHRLHRNLTSSECCAVGTIVAASKGHYLTLIVCVSLSHLDHLQTSTEAEIQGRFSAGLPSRIFSFHTSLTFENAFFEWVTGRRLDD